MTIVEPNLVVTKSTTTTNLNVGFAAPYTINVQNTGGAAAWNTTITDNLPAGMCAYDPRATVAAGFLRQMVSLRFLARLQAAQISR